VDRLGDGLTATAWAPDGTIEAIELDGRFAVGADWHTEAGDKPTLLRALVDAALVSR